MTIDDYRAQARARWGRATPYRVGFMVGMAADEDLVNPYHPAAHGHTLFRAGRNFGRQHRQMTQERDHGNDA